MRKGLFVLMMLACAAAPVAAQVSIGIGVPNASIGINLSSYPELVPVRGYPVYYAPGVSSNYFFYDGMYWVYQDDYWYSSGWYNGPWREVAPEYVPEFVLRVPVSYYRRPPPYFRGWRGDASPHWGEHYGNDWAQRRNGWDRWDRSNSPAAAPLPVYQRQYSGDRYPRAEQQRALQGQNYRYQPRDPVVRDDVARGRVQDTAAPAPRVIRTDPRTEPRPDPRSDPRIDPRNDRTVAKQPERPPQRAQTQEPRTPNREQGAEQGDRNQQRNQGNPSNQANPVNSRNPGDQRGQADQGKAPAPVDRRAQRQGKDREQEQEKGGDRTNERKG